MISETVLHQRDVIVHERITAILHSGMLPTYEPRTAMALRRALSLGGQQALE